MSRASDDIVNASQPVAGSTNSGEGLRRASFLAEIIDSLHSEVVVLDEEGVIQAVNAAWNRFAQENGLNPARVAPGINYLEVCRQAFQKGNQTAGVAIGAIEEVLNGSATNSVLEYSCDSPKVPRWFNMRVKRLPTLQGRIVIEHEDITQLKEAQRFLSLGLAQVEGLKAQIQQENVYLRERVKAHTGHGIVGQSGAIRRMLEAANQVAATDSTVLLQGETGTGKELLAHYVHVASGRRERTMVCVNCAAMPSTLVESELFGREKGAFTGSLSRQIGRFELADESTIFLDELGELSMDVQAKLLRVLEARQIERLGNPKPVSINVRIIAATNQDLSKAVQEGRFRQDLYYRLNVFPITVPPLRQRIEDIPPLVWTFVDEFARTFNKNVESITGENMEALQRYDWPGNIRELRNVIERAMIINNGPKLRIQLPPAVAALASASGRKLEEVERQHVLSALEESGWRVRGGQGAAERLGLKPTTLEAKMVKLGIGRPGAAPRHAELAG